MADLTKETQRWLREFVETGPRPLFATLSGAHLYGFESPDSDYDLRGAFVAPLASLLGLRTPPETVDLFEDQERGELDWVAHDVKKFVRLMTRRNGYVLEQLYSPLVITGGPWMEELRALGQGCIIRQLHHHYAGFAVNQRRLLDSGDETVKRLLYCYRVLLSGIHVLRAGEFEQHESEGGDHVIYSLAKFIRLALQGNPNLLETLYTHPDDVIFVNAAGQQLIDSRECFLSKQVGLRFLGYAQHQQQRMDRHRRWLIDPPTGAPQPEEFGAQLEGGRAKFADADQRKAFDAAVKHWSHFRTWRANRNPSRAALEDAYGYDSKHGMHPVRLLRMGIEVSNEHTLHVRRPDAVELLALRDGSLDYAALQRMVEEHVNELQRAVESSTLPDEPDAATAEALLIQLHTQALRDA